MTVHDLHNSGFIHPTSLYTTINSPVNNAIMPRQNTYGRQSKRSKAERLFAELPQSPIRPPITKLDHDPVGSIADKLSIIQIDDSPKPNSKLQRKAPIKEPPPDDSSSENSVSDDEEDTGGTTTPPPKSPEVQSREQEPSFLDDSLRILTWDDVCPHGDTIEKIAEASYAEVYRVSNDRGTSIIKVIRLQSPIKAQTKTQIQSKLVDEQPRPDQDVDGELQISQWLADIPGFVVYKERYNVQGKTSRQLLETHQKFQRKLKRQDPGRAQFYPSPSRYLDDTRFLVVELGDAGIALEDWKLTTQAQLWDVFFLVAIALARAEELAMFEHRDLHEGNLCVRQVREPDTNTDGSTGYQGLSGLDITILDYGLSRAEDVNVDFADPVCYDLEKDLSFFTSTHAPQCEVYRQMRSFILRADRKCLPPEGHKTPYAKGVNGTLSWEVFAPYTNVLWLAYIYSYLIDSFKGERKELQNFKKETSELWKYLNPNAEEDVPCFGSAIDLVGFAVESGWVTPGQLAGSSNSMLERDGSIIFQRDVDEEDDDGSLRRSPRRRRTQDLGF